MTNKKQYLLLEHMASDGGYRFKTWLYSTRRYQWKVKQFHRFIRKYGRKPSPREYMGIMSDSYKNRRIFL